MTEGHLSWVSLCGGLKVTPGRMFARVVIRITGRLKENGRQG